MAGSGHFGYRDLISDFRTLLTILAINFLHEVRLYSFFESKKLIVCVTNFDHNLLLSWPFVGGGSILYKCQAGLEKSTRPLVFTNASGCRASEILDDSQCKLIFYPYMSIIFVKQGKCLF